MVFVTKHKPTPDLHAPQLSKKYSYESETFDAGAEKYSSVWYTKVVWNFLEHPSSSVWAFRWMCINISIITVRYALSSMSLSIMRQVVRAC